MLRDNQKQRSTPKEQKILKKNDKQRERKERIGLKIDLDLAIHRMNLHMLCVVLVINACGAASTIIIFIIMCSYVVFVYVLYVNVYN